MRALRPLIVTSDIPGLCLACAALRLALFPPFTIRTNSCLFRRTQAVPLSAMEEMTPVLNGRRTPSLWHVSTCGVAKIGDE